MPRPSPPFPTPAPKPQEPVPPTTVAGAPSGATLAQPIASLDDLARAFPHNAAKPSEFGDAGASVGVSEKPGNPAATAGTSSETTPSPKTGSGTVRLGENPGNGPLDRVRVDSTGRALTTNQGVAVADNQNSLKAGSRGPALLEDFILREKITHFDHERIPERVVHARGSGAHGYFECTDPLHDVTHAAPFAEAGKRTPVFVRFSTVAGERGSADTVRDARGFAVKFYTEAGNWDLVGNNIPVFFIQDAMKFPDLVHALKPEPHHGMPQAASAHDTFWDFVSLMPESTHMLMWVMSDRAIPRSYRMMQGFGVHTFRDPTKLVPEELVPVRVVGRMVLNRNPDNFFAETEQVAFCAANVVPGIDFSNDPLLAGRLHSYADAQLSRLGGPNFHEIPINASLAQVHNNQRDGLHRQAIPRGAVAYEPNSLGGGCPFQAGSAGFTSFREPVAGDKVRGKPERFAEHYQQATLFWNSQSEAEKRHIEAAFRFELTKVRVPAVRERVVAQLPPAPDAVGVAQQPVTESNSSLNPGDPP